MCETTDPVTDGKNSSALVRVSIVDGVNPSEVLLDSLVAPNWPISEMRTRIHGIAESNLTGVTFTLRHAQAFLMKVCSDQTIIVGHALHHDLRALKLQHKYVSSSFFPSPPSLPLSHDLSL
jgi:RNA exonuclease 1